MQQRRKKKIPDGRNCCAAEALFENMFNLIFADFDVWLLLMSIVLY
jgi:hypothetical protein